MKDIKKVSFLFNFFPLEIEGVDSLIELALDMTWSWNHLTDQIWQELEPDLWAQTNNPWIVLRTVSRARLKELFENTEFRKRVDDLLKQKRELSQKPSWFQKNYPNSPLTRIAYFSMEFMLSEALPIYSGGLGNVAGDQLKAASDLGVPVVGIGLLYQQGYFRQIIDKDGKQEASYPYNDISQMPILPVRAPNGEWLRIQLSFPGYSLYLRVWQVIVGNVHLYLLDSNDAANYPAYRGITSELYGAGSDLRLRQELILGIGGWRLLDALGIKPEVCHLNEGHAAFAILDRVRSFMQETGESFETALTATRSGNVFTTHTAVSAGFDRFSPDQIELYLSAFAKDQLGISMNDLLALGRLDPNNSAEFFNMAYLAIRGSGSVNGVSRLHGKVSRHIFEPLFPRWPENEVPVGHVTNGIHVPSWHSEESDKIWSESCGMTHWHEALSSLVEKLSKVPDLKLWHMRNHLRQNLVAFARQRLTRQLAVSGGTAEQIKRAGRLFDPNIMTLGFARRFATYKRPNLLLHDPERLLRLLSNPQRPVQLIIAGKAHPEDLAGQALIQQWVQFIRREDVRPHAIFLSDDDMLLTEQLVQGVDVWINTPRRPWEACGTSGMKILANGGINCSELDGWWVEAYKPELGWALGDGKEHGDDPAWDAMEANTLYDLLEREIVPQFYARDSKGIPITWVAKMRKSMGQLTYQYSANRAVIDYMAKHYIPSAEIFRERSKNKAALAKEIVDWKHSIEKNWPFLRFEAVKVDTQENQHRFEVYVYLNELNPNAVKVELFSDDGVQQMDRVSDASGVYTYQTSVSASKPAEYFTPRLVPFHEGVPIPLEIDKILWQR